MNKLTQSIKIKLAAYAEKRGLTKQEALNEALDRALSVNRMDIDLKTSFLVIDNFNQGLRTQDFLRRYRKAI